MLPALRVHGVGGHVASRTVPASESAGIPDRHGLSHQLCMGVRYLKLRAIKKLSTWITSRSFRTLIILKTSPAAAIRLKNS